MTTTSDVEWLRERPEIVEAAADAEGFYFYLERDKGHWCVMAEQMLVKDFGVDEEAAEKEASRLNAWHIIVSTLPHLRAAIREDVVRELAGDVGNGDPREVVIEMLARCNMTSRDLVSHQRKNVEEIILRERAAAHAQGRAAGREEAAKVLDDCGFDDLAAAVRGLP